MITRNEYKNLSTKTSAGSVVQVYADARIDRMTLYTWPITDTVGSYIKLSARRRIDDLDSLANTASFPSEWLLTLSTNLAYWIAPELGVGMEKLQIIQKQATETLQAIISYDQEGLPFSVECE